MQAIAAIVLAVGGYFTYRNLRVTQERLDVDRQEQITNRFTQAIHQLGAMKEKEPNLEVRLGGIYALERIAGDSPRDHWTIMEILTAYVRQNAGWTEPSPPEDVPSKHASHPDPPEEPPPLRTDIQAIMTVIRRRKWSNDPPANGLDLHATDLRGAKIRAAHLEYANLRGAHLEGADLMFTRLNEANLYRADLEGATLMSGDLAGADLNYADLQWTRFLDANLWWASLRGANLWKANLSSTNITQEQVYSAFQHGEGAYLPEDWPKNWRDRLSTSIEQPPLAPPPT